MSRQLDSTPAQVCGSAGLVRSRSAASYKSNQANSDARAPTLWRFHYVCGVVHVSDSADDGGGKVVGGQPSASHQLAFCAHQHGIRLRFKPSDRPTCTKRSWQNFECVRWCLASACSGVLSNVNRYLVHVPTIT